MSPIKDPLLVGLSDDDRRELVRRGVNFKELSEYDRTTIRQYRELMGLD